MDAATQDRDVNLGRLLGALNQAWNEAHAELDRRVRQMGDATRFAFEAEQQADKLRAAVEAQESYVSQLSELMDFLRRLP